jgi:predicted MFS family arabinose efflux permease
MWLLLFCAFITRGSFYMVWPFISIILYQRFGISATGVGLILSVATLVSVFVGDIVPNKQTREFAMQMRYLVLSAGAVIWLKSINRQNPAML